MVEYLSLHMPPAIAVCPKLTIRKVTILFKATVTTSENYFKVKLNKNKSKKKNCSRVTLIIQRLKNLGKGPKITRNLDIYANWVYPTYLVA